MWFTVNGVEAAKVASLANPPSVDVRDVGNQGEASDGSLVLTRLTTKRDVKLSTRALSGEDSIAWEQLLRGEGHVFSFDSNKYSSKGLAPVDNDGAHVSSPAPKYGAKSLELDVDQTINWPFGYGSTWTWAAWFQNATVLDAAWHHVVTRSDGKAWLDGARDDSPPLLMPWDFAGGVTLRFNGADPGVSYIDDLVVCPYLWPLDWPRQVFEAGAAFGPTPYVTCAGLLVPESATRKMACKSVKEKLMVANVGAGMARDVRELEVELVGA